MVGDEKALGTLTLADWAVSNDVTNGIADVMAEIEASLNGRRGMMSTAYADMSQIASKRADETDAGNHSAVR